MVGKIRVSDGGSMLLEKGLQIKRKGEMARGKCQNEEGNRYRSSMRMAKQAAMA